VTELGTGTELNEREETEEDSRRRAPQQRGSPRRRERPVEKGGWKGTLSAHEREARKGWARERKRGEGRTHSSLSGGSSSLLLSLSGLSSLLLSELLGGDCRGTIKDRKKRRNKARSAKRKRTDSV